MRGQRLSEAVRGGQLRELAPSFPALDPQPPLALDRLTSAPSLSYRHETTTSSSSRMSSSTSAERFDELAQTVADLVSRSAAQQGQIDDQQRRLSSQDQLILELRAEVAGLKCGTARLDDDSVAELAALRAQNEVLSAEVASLQASVVELKQDVGRLDRGLDVIEGLVVPPARAWIEVGRGGRRVRQDGDGQGGGRSWVLRPVRRASDVLLLCAVP